MKKYRITIVLGIIFVIGILSAACANMIIRLLQQ